MSSSGSARHLAVFDVGKTNKKLHVYDENLHLIDTQSAKFEPLMRDDVVFHDIPAILEWYTDALSRISTRYNIELITAATHGATFVCLDAEGSPSVPVIDYTYEPGEEFHRRFFGLVGNPNQLQVETATLELKALVNTAQGIYFLKTNYPAEFDRTTHIVFFPQFFTHWLTGEICADYTYVGCHTYLFDYASHSYSGVADRLGIRELLPATLVDAGTVMGRIRTELAERTGILPTTVVTAGIHDSNASLLPYLVKKRGEEIIVNSTGTWCVAMHPADQVSFGDDEIGKAVFFNMSALRKPVKTSILLGGLEFETWTEILRRQHSSFELPEFHADLYQKVISDNSEFILPGVVRGTGQFPESEAGACDHGEWFPLETIRTGTRAPSFFSDFGRAVAVLNLSLAVQTRVALERVGLSAGASVYTEGGFRNNRDYNAVLAALCPRTSFFLSGMDEATSFGAALLGWAKLDHRSLDDRADSIAIVEDPVDPVDLPGLEKYAEHFVRLATVRADGE